MEQSRGARLSLSGEAADLYWPVAMREGVVVCSDTFLGGAACRRDNEEETEQSGNVSDDKEPRDRPTVKSEGGLNLRCRLEKYWTPKPLAP